MELVVEKEVLKNSLKELVDKEPLFVEALLKELASDLKKRRLEEIVNEDFEEYGAVFKKLS